VGLVTISLGFLSVGVVFHFVPPILPVVVGDLGIGHGTAGLLMSLFALPGMLLSLPGGWLVDRYGERVVGGTGLIVMGAGTLWLGLAPTVPLILAARVVSGLGALVGVVALQRLVIRLFCGRGLGLPLGVSGGAIPLGIILVLNTAGPLAEAAGWRTVAVRAGGLTIGIGLCFLAVIWAITRGQALGRPADRSEAPLADQGRILRPIWIAAGVWFCANGAMTAFMTFAPDYYRELGYDPAGGGLLTSIPMWTSAVLGVVSGWLTDRHGGRAAFLTAGMALMGLSLLLLPTAVLPPVIIGLALGLSLGLVVTPTMALPGALLPATHVGRGYGILATCANLGIFTVPPAAGLLRDHGGGYLWPFVLAGAVACAGVAAGTWLWLGRYTPGFSRRHVRPATIPTAGPLDSAVPAGHL
jgi:MFS family permease